MILPRPPPGADEVLAREERSVHVRLEAIVPFLDRHVHPMLPDRIEARVIDEDGRDAEPPRGRFEEFGDGRWLTHIDLHHECLPPRPSHFFAGVLGALLVREPGDRYIRSLRAEIFRDSLPDARIRARHDCDFAFQRFVHGTSPRSLDADGRSTHRRNPFANSERSIITLSSGSPRPWRRP